LESPPGQEPQPEPEPEQPPTYIGALALGHMAHGVVPLTRTHHSEPHGLLVGARTLGKPPKCKQTQKKQPQQTPAPTVSALALGHVPLNPPPREQRIRIWIRCRGVACAGMSSIHTTSSSFRGFPKKKKQIEPKQSEPSVVVEAEQGASAPAPGPIHKA